eukprot:15480505-Alexandrium_andersonii.AAC.1
MFGAWPLPELKKLSAEVQQQFWQESSSDKGRPEEGSGEASRALVGRGAHCIRGRPLPSAL